MADRSDWLLDAGPANLRFHEVIVGIHRSARITEVFRRLMTELRLGFLAVTDPAAFHGAFLTRNREIHRRMTEEGWMTPGRNSPPTSTTPRTWSSRPSRGSS